MYPLVLESIEKKKMSCGTQRFWPTSFFRGGEGRGGGARNEAQDSHLQYRKKTSYLFFLFFQTKLPSSSFSHISHMGAGDPSRWLDPTDP